MDLSLEQEIATEIAQHVGAKLVEWQSDIKTVERKDASNSYVTKADRKAQQLIVEQLSAQFPDDSFLGEENSLEPDGEDRVWIIDPIDGTTNYVRGYPAYTVSIALRHNDEYIVGVIYNPVTDECFTAAKGDRAQRNGQAISVSTTDDLKEALLTTYKSDVQALQQLQNQIKNIRVTGTAALDAAHVAAGWSDAYLDNVIHEWDIAAAACIIQEAGGKVRIRQGNEERGHVHFLGTNQQLFDSLKELVQQ